MLGGAAFAGGAVPGITRLSPSIPTERSAYVSLGGPIHRGHHKLFVEVVESVKPDIIVLDSPGGSIGEALLIGTEIRQRGLNVFVYGNRECGSACALLFLSGIKKYAKPGALIGLHSGMEPDGTPSVEGTNAMEDYLNWLGADPRLILAMKSTPPSEMFWLSEKAKREIDVEDPARAAQERR